MKERKKLELIGIQVHETSRGDRVVLQFRSMGSNRTTNTAHAFHLDEGRNPSQIAAILRSVAEELEEEGDY